MSITLTWDLFLIVFFAIVVTYGFIIGKHQSVKVIVATYIATVAVQGIANIMERLTTGESSEVMVVLGLTVDNTMLTIIKLVVFVSVIIVVAARAGIEIEYTKEPGTTINTIITGVLGFATAGLLISTLLTFISGSPLLETSIAQAGTLSLMVGGSSLMQLMINYQDLWFSLPALVLVGVGLFSSE